jgi:hypothetical protein
VSIRGGIWRLALSISDGQTWLSDQAPGFSTPSTKKVQSKFVIAKGLCVGGQGTALGSTGGGGTGMQFDKLGITCEESSQLIGVVLFSGQYGVCVWWKKRSDGKWP